MSEFLTNLIAALQANRSGFGDEPLSNMLGEECALPHLTVTPATSPTPAEEHAQALEKHARPAEIGMAIAALVCVFAVLVGIFAKHAPT